MKVKASTLILKLESMWTMMMSISQDASEFGFS